ncbi:MAG TPA: fibronectin type III domain-containing protein, partial [Deltaproteobacteria bacterium]|nr:fibronectin type III domain-containing protein [Deltaproteobacteria bacterium]
MQSSRCPRINTCLATALFLVLLACITACDSSSSDDPPAQASVTLQAQADSADEVTLEWETTAAGVTGFRIERAEGSGDFQEIAQAGGTDTSYTDTGLSAGVTYSYRVWAVGDDGDIACSAGVEVTTPNAIILTALAVSTSGIDLSWEYSGDDEEGFRIERRTAGTDFTEVAEVGAGQDSYSDTGLDSGTGYTYRVWAFDSDGDILCSPEASATTHTPTPPASGAIIADHTSIDLEAVPSEWIEEAKAALHIAYGHTSHGSQITTGMSGLVGFMGDDFAYNSGGTGGALDLRDSPFSGASDLGNPDREAWEAATRDYLDGHPEVNVIMWSWCGQADTTQENIDLYLSLMEGLEGDYPGVRFVYMTGHLNGTGLEGN